MGLFVTLTEPTAPMKKEAASAGVLDTPFGSGVVVQSERPNIEEVGVIDVAHHHEVKEPIPVVISPEYTPEKGDVVYCKVKGRQYLHLVSAIKGERYQISNNKGHVNGWIGINQIFGLLKTVE